MNILESYNVENPFGKMDKCARFTIDDALTPFTLHNITLAQRLYTLSFWIKSETEGSLTVYDNTLTTTDSWRQYDFTFTADKANLAFKFNITGVYYIYNPKLEIGNQVTDWTPAPEDIDTELDNTNGELRQIITEQSTAIVNDCEAIIFQALQKYTESGDFEEFRNTVSTELELMAGKIEFNFTNTTEQLTQINGELQTNFTELYNYIHFVDGDIVLGSSENSITLTLENDMIVFKKNGERFGWWDGVDFHTGNIIVEVNERAQFGNFAFVPRSDGSLSFLKVGGE